LSTSTTRLEIPLDQSADAVVLQAELEALGVVVIDAMAYENYQGKGPYLLLAVQGPVPANLVEFVQESVRKRPAPPKATFLFLRSPSGAVWRVGVDDAGQLHVEGMKEPALPKSRKP
jgi:hypothetical protein